MPDGWTENNFADTHPYHEGKSCGKFGLILPSGLGGDSVMDGCQADGQKNNVALAHLIIRENHVPSLANFPHRWTCQTDGRTKK